jgi:aspartate racemase
MTARNTLVGVLGGMGPDATVDFMAKVIAMTPAQGDQDHVHMIVDHNPAVPNRQAAILGGGEDPAPALVEMAKRLASAGADFLVIPCNTAYVFAESIVAAVDIPLISIIDVTIDALRERAPEAATIGVLATNGCLAAGVFQDALSNAGLDVVLPDENELSRLMELIYGIKGGDQGEAVASAMAGIGRALETRGAQAIIAGCTEIPLVLDGSMLSVPLISSTDELARRTVELAKEQ